AQGPYTLSFDLMKVVMSACRNSVLTFFVILPIICWAQTERWVYRYTGDSTYNYDEALCIVYGLDNNLYAGGYSTTNSNEVFTIISLTNSGIERWVYTSGNGAAHAICYGNGSIYSAGNVNGHFTIISLTSEGTERWIYLYPQSSNVISLCFGADGNVYGVGYTQGDSILVVSVDTNGIERWHYIYPTPSAEALPGRSITYGIDGNIYVAGYTGPVWDTDVTVISLTPTGSERWVYLYNGPGGTYDYGNCIVYGSDDNLYIFGSTCYLGGSGEVFTVGLAISLTNLGNERWTYISSAGISRFAGGVYGGDGNLYGAGDVGWDIPFFLVESISDSGTYRWQYIDTTWGFGTSIVYGNDGNIYAGGITSNTWQGGESYFTVISFTDNGTQNWTYKKHGYGNYSDIAHSVVYGLDGNIYAAGTICDSITWGDFAVISLSSTGIKESERLKVEGKGLKLMVLPNVITENAKIQYTIPETQRIYLKLYDITGREVLEIARGIVDEGVHSHPLNTSNIGSGIYFLVLAGEKDCKVEKILIVRGEDSGEWSF
ncbi:MAG: T9SS type A sorting domain-containing protein, partial [candidate division WOR-3 bacterium]